MRGICVDETMGLDHIINLRLEDAVTRYRIGKNNVMEIAETIGAVVKVGKRRLIYRPKMDEYFSKIAE